MSLVYGFQIPTESYITYGSLSNGHVFNSHEWSRF